MAASSSLNTPALLANWAGNFTYHAPFPDQPASIEEVRELVKRHPRLKVLGTRHCFNDMADSNDRLISLSRLDKIISLDPVAHTVTIEAGVRYGELATWLNGQGYALHNLASLPHISVAGGCITATHGSGIHNGNLSTAVTTIEWIAASGETIRLSRQDPEFAGAVVNLGGLGVITRLTLAIQPTYQVQQTVYEDLPVPQLEQHFETILSAGYSVSLFTDWREPVINSVWIKSLTSPAASANGFLSTLSPATGSSTAATGFPTTSATLSPADSTALPPAAPATFFGATPAAQDVHPIRDTPAQNCTPQMGIPGPWHERLPHFRLGFTPSSGKELQSEYFVPFEHSVAAIRAITGLREKIAPHLFTSEIRCIGEDDLWMSPCYQQRSTAIHFTWQQNTHAVNALLPLIEEQLAPFRARPHWGKLFTIPHTRLRALYPRFSDFQQLLYKYDPSGKFRNDYLDRVIFGQ